MNEIRVAIRQLSRTPAFTIVAVLTLALGIGANTAIFGALHRVMLKPLPYPDSDRLVAINVRTPNAGDNTAEHRTVASIDFASAGLAADARRRFHDDLVARMQQMSSVRSAGIGAVVPGLGRSPTRTTRTVEGGEVTQAPEVPFNVVDPTFLEALGVDVVVGRAFAASDTSGPPVALVNEAFVREHLGGARAVGQVVRFGDEDTTLVGVVRDHRHRSLLTPTEPQTFSPLSRFPLSQFNLVLDTIDDGPSAADLRALVRAIEPRARIRSVDRLAALLSGVTAPERSLAAFSAALGSLGLVMAAVGVFGVVGYAADQRTKELRMRQVLGATPRQVVALVARRSLTAVLIGNAVGLLGVWTVAGSLASFLHGVAPSDATVTVTAVFTVSAAMLIAALVPARRCRRLELRNL